MRRKFSVVVALSIGLILAAGSAGMAGFSSPGPGVTGNDTGGIFPYSPDVAPFYRQIAADYCARWNRLSHVTSVTRRYGGYVGFVCMDKPWMIH
jgi:hypothetical protein